MMIAGGAEAAVTPLAIAGFQNMKALSTRNDSPEKASRPFDKDRDGFVLAEGAGFAVLETEEHARARGARILGWLEGYGSTLNAYRITDSPPDGRGAAQAMQAAIADARLDSSEIGDINAHVMPAPVHELWATEQYLPALEGHPQVFGPGERFAYNNSGYVVLAIIAERAGGKPGAGALRVGWTAADAAGHGQG